MPEYVVRGNITLISIDVEGAEQSMSMKLETGSPAHPLKEYVHSVLKIPVGAPVFHVPFGTLDVAEFVMINLGGEATVTLKNGVVSKQLRMDGGMLLLQNTHVTGIDVLNTDTDDIDVDVKVLGEA